MSARVLVPPLSPFEALVATVGAMAALLVTLWGAAAAIPAVGESLAAAGLIQIAVYGAASVWLVRHRDPASAAATARVLGFARASVPTLVVALLLGVVVHGPAEFLEWASRQLAPVPEEVLRERARRLSPESTFARATVFAIVAVLAPLVEELFFRGALYARLVAGVPIRVAVVVTSVCFCISHPEPRLWPALLCVAVVLGLTRAASRGILPCFLLHAAFNATTLAVAFVQPRAVDVTHGPSPVFTALGTVLTVAGVALIVRRGRLSASASANTDAATGAARERP